MKQPNIDTTIDKRNFWNSPAKLFCWAVFAAQIGHNIQIANFQLVLKQIMKQVVEIDTENDDHIGSTAFALSIASSFDLLGTAIGGALSNRGYESKNVLPVSMVFRMLVVYLIAFMFQLSSSAPLLFVCLSAVDYIFVGILDTTRSMIVLKLEPDSFKRKIMNSDIETWFHVGNVLGPLAGALLLSVTNESIMTVIYLPGILFTIASAMYSRLRLLMNKEENEVMMMDEESVLFSPSANDDTKSEVTNVDIPSSQNETTVKWFNLALLFIMTGCLQFNRLKNVLPTIFIALDASKSQWKSVVACITGSFGFGNALGAYLARFMAGSLSSFGQYSFGIFSLILFSFTFMVRDVYSIIALVIISNCLLGVSTIHLNTEIQDAVIKDYWLIGANRSFMRLSLVFQKIFIAAILGTKVLASMDISLQVITGMFLVLSLVYTVCTFLMREREEKQRYQPL